MIELFTVVDVTGGNLRARAAAGSSWTDKVHCFDTEGAAKRRRTLLANRHPGREFAIFVTVIRSHGAIASEWLSDVTFQVSAG